MLNTLNVEIFHVINFYLNIDELLVDIDYSHNPFDTVYVHVHVRGGVARKKRLFVQFGLSGVPEPEQPLPHKLTRHIGAQKNVWVARQQRGQPERAMQCDQPRRIQLLGHDKSEDGRQWSERQAQRGRGRDAHPRQLADQKNQLGESLQDRQAESALRGGGRQLVAQF